MRSVFLAPLIALALVTGCGGDDVSPGAAVADAATKTRDAGSSRVFLHAEMSGGGLPDAVEFGGEGSFDYEGMKGVFSYDMGELIPGTGGGKVEMVQDGLVLYMQFPEGSEAQLPAGKRWLKIDVAALGEESGVDLAQLSQLNQGDPSQMLRYLRGASDEVEDVGEEEVRGVPTTHYRADVDLEKAAEQSLDDVPPEQRDAVRKSIDRLVQSLGTKTIPVNVWIDDEGRPRKFEMTYAMTLPGQSESLRTKITMELFDFGVEVDAEPPTPAEVVDLANLVASGGQ